jgi:hypothetical protein
MKTRVHTAFAGAAVLLCGLLATAPAASATSATATLTGGSLAFVSSPPAVSFAGTLNGSNQALTTTQAIDIGDASGSGLGWNVTATSTQFTVGAKTLSTSATTVPTAPVAVCDATITCTVATNAIAFPYSLPAAPTTAPTATKLFNAAAGTGMANQTFTPTWSLAIPASTLAGAYISTWTESLVSAP